MYGLGESGKNISTFRECDGFGYDMPQSVAHHGILQNNTSSQMSANYFNGKLQPRGLKLQCCFHRCVQKWSYPLLKFAKLATKAISFDNKWEEFVIHLDFHPGSVRLINIELLEALFFSCADDISAIHNWNVTTCLLVT